ncbi:MAG: hypothetical protein WCE63_12115 [Acidobacteriaceae bacterium]
MPGKLPGTTAPPAAGASFPSSASRRLRVVDAEFDSERNHLFCRELLQANSVIPATRFTSRRATGTSAQMRANFPRKIYGKRSVIESVFSAIKRKLSCRAPGRTIATKSRQALLLGLTFNLYRLWLPTII